DQLKSLDDPEKPYLASMGIYVFKTDALKKLLDTSDGDDFGKNIIPTALEKQKVSAHIFKGFWEDIGTIRRFYEVNLALAQKNPPFDLYSPQTPIYTRPRFLPGSEIYGASLENVLIADGCTIASATIRNSVVGLRSRVGDSVTMTNTVMMGADYFESDAHRAANRAKNIPDMGVGSGSVIDGAIIDKNARIGKGVIIRQLENRANEENENWVIKDNLVIIPKNGIIKDGTVI
ncbi:MAG: sugar phosphate nucleotidyltransferase, partial [Chloroflexota bacterium]